MTIAAGFRCQDGYVIFADTQLTGGTAKSSTNKIWVHEDSGLQIVVAAAGSYSLMRLTWSHIKRAVAGLQKLADVRDAIEKVLKRIHDDYIDPSAGGLSVEMILAISTSDETDLFEHDQWAVVPVDDTGATF